MARCVKCDACGIVEEGHGHNIDISFNDTFQQRQRTVSDKRIEVCNGCKAEFMRAIEPFFKNAK